MPASGRACGPGGGLGGFTRRRRMCRRGVRGACEEEAYGAGARAVEIHNNRCIDRRPARVQVEPQAERRHESARMRGKRIRRGPTRCGSHEWQRNTPANALVMRGPHRPPLSARQKSSTGVPAPASPFGDHQAPPARRGVHMRLRNAAAHSKRARARPQIGCR